jgi:DNA polymerase-3 subunit epsilon
MGSTSLVELPVLALDVQATAAAARGGALLEVGWARAPRDGAPVVVSAHVVAPEGDVALPRQVERLTGLTRAEWRQGVTPAVAWSRLAAEARGAGPLPTVVHYARFEAPFLHALHASHGHGAFPLELVCTHAIARRLLPELPRATLRALAGYFGAAVPPLRRCAGHVEATAFVWRHLALLLVEREGVTDLSALRAWLERPARRAPRSFALGRETRRALPAGPGVYRFLRAGGAVLYVGKATSLRTRVASHFHDRGRTPHERSLEMLTQARDVDCTPTETALEAALLEADEIKRLAPPYNVALTEAGRRLCFASPQLDDLVAEPDAEHPVGPLPSPAPLDALLALRALVGARERATCALRARALGVEPRWAPDPECFDPGLDRFVREHGLLLQARDVERLGRALWTTLRHDRAEEDAPPARERGARAWDPDRVVQALESTVARATHAARRARWLLRFVECSLRWSEPGASASRLLELERGQVVERAWVAIDAPLPGPRGHGPGRLERQRGFDLATYDRLRVLVTELRALAPRVPHLELRLGPHVRLSRPRLLEVLRWI